MIGSRKKNYRHILNQSEVKQKTVIVTCQISCSRAFSHAWHPLLVFAIDVSPYLKYPVSATFFAYPTNPISIFCLLNVLLTCYYFFFMTSQTSTLLSVGCNKLLTKLIENVKSIKAMFTSCYLFKLRLGLILQKY